MNDFYANSNDGIRLFAKAGISAATAINSGALITVFSQLGEVLEVAPKFEVVNAIQLWAFGVAVATLGWVFAALSASAFASSKRKTEITMGFIGYICVIASTLCFLFGFYNVSYGISNAG